MPDAEPEPLDLLIEYSVKHLDAQWDQWKHLDTRAQFLIAVIAAGFALSLAHLAVAETSELIIGTLFLFGTWTFAILALYSAVIAFSLSDFARPPIPAGDSLRSSMAVQRQWLVQLRDAQELNALSIRRKKLALWRARSYIFGQAAILAVLVLGVRLVVKLNILLLPLEYKVVISLTTIILCSIIINSSQKFAAVLRGLVKDTLRSSGDYEKFVDGLAPVWLQVGQVTSVLALLVATSAAALSFGWQWAAAWAIVGLVVATRSLHWWPFPDRFLCFQWAIHECEKMERYLAVLGPDTDYEAYRQLHRALVEEVAARGLADEKNPVRRLRCNLVRRIRGWKHPPRLRRIRQRLRSQLRH